MADETSTSKKVRGFPNRQMSQMSNSDTSSLSSSTIVVMSSSELNKVISAEARLAFAELITTILKLDFDEQDDESSEFQSKTLQLVAKNADLGKSVKLSMEAKDEDLASQISQIKSDAYVVKNSPICLLGAILHTVLSEGTLDSRHRVLFRHVCALLSILWDDFEEVEDTLVYCLVEGYNETEAQRSDRMRSEKMKKIKRYALVGTSAGIGGLLIGLTGGLAAPLVAAGAGLFVGTGAVAGLATTTGAAIFGSLFGAAGASLTGYKMSKRVGAVEEFQIECLTEGYSLHTVLCVSGWINEDDGEDAFKIDWRHLQASKEQYTLRFESRYLLELGKAIEYMVSVAANYAIQTTLMQTALAGLLSAIAWPLVLISASNVIDNPWNVMTNRAVEVGEELAEVLLSHAHGNRPITLVGFSLGARVIFHALLAMSKRQNFRGIIEDVVLLGAPVSASPKQWLEISRVIGGRIINGYCSTDWVLRFLYRTMSLQFSIAGTSPIEIKRNRKIVNFNLSHIIKSHFDYSKKLPEVLTAVGIKVRPRSEASTNDLQAYCEAQNANENVEKVDDKQDEKVTKNMEKLQMSDGPDQSTETKFSIDNDVVDGSVDGSESVETNFNVDGSISTVGKK